MPLIELFKGSARKKHEKILAEIIDIQHRHNLVTDEDLLRRAFDFSLRVHEGQKRKDGREYIVHPLAVARTAADYWMDDVSVASALLHDTVEDAEGVTLTRGDIESEFGPHVASIVEGVTKLKSQEFDRFSSKIETLKKILATTVREDIRTIIIKIFDRHDNVKSLDVFRKLRDGKEKQTRIELETHRFYIPIAARLGLFKVAREMEDSLMLSLNPKTYDTLSKWVSQKKHKVKPQVDNICQQIRMSLETSGVDCIEKFYHKGIYQIYEQVEQQGMGMQNLDNIIAYNLTLIVPTEDDCYRTLGIVHRLFPHLRDSMFDFINNPKVNGYQSLHTVILVPDLPKLQVLIRTPDMDTRNHLGLIADIRSNASSGVEDLVHWIDKLVSSFDVIGHKDFFDVTSKVLFQEIEVVTPRGEQVLLPVGSTALDFAFNIHSEIALHAKYAEIDGKERKLSTVLKKGQRVNIVTDKVDVQAKVHWFNWVGNTTSRLALKKHFKKEQRKQVEKEGDRFAAFCKEKLGLKVEPDSETFTELYQCLGYAGRNDFLEDLFTGRLMYEFVVPKLVLNIGMKECKRLCKLLDEKGIIPHNEARSLIRECTDSELRENLSVRLDDSISQKVSFSDYVDIPALRFPLPIHFARCCHPNPDMPILALTSKGKGAVIHAADCSSVAGLREYGSVNLVEATWKRPPTKRKVFVRFEGTDRPNLLHDLTHCFHDVKSNILSISIKVSQQNTFSGEMLFEVSDVVSKEMLSEKFGHVKSLHVSDIEFVQ
jgi:GTP pyrophosphokinase